MTETAFAVPTRDCAVWPGSYRYNDPSKKSGGRTSEEKFIPTTAEAIRAAVGQRFARVARSPSQEKKFPVGPESAKKLGYDPKEIDALPPSVADSFCGVGNPLGLGEIRPGQAVLDLGSRAGVDCLLAARRVGPTGKVIGVDLCPEMVEKARRNASLLALHNVVFVQAGIEKLPLPDVTE
jgi:protein-L-isoaspartate O-methyltransferase